MNAPLRDAAWQRRRQWFLELRAIDIPTSVVRRFFRIDGLRKAMLVAFNLFITLIPLAIFALAIANRHGRDYSLSDVFIRQFGLEPATADIMRHTFPANGDVLRIISVVVVGSFAISGLDVASAFQRTFAAAWNVAPIHGWRGWWRGAVWFGLMLATFWLGQMLYRLPETRGGVMYLVAVPVVLLANYWFWLVTPALMLDQRLERRYLRAGAIVGAVGGATLWWSSLVFLRSWFQWYGEGFNGIGIALALLSWIYVISIVWVLVVVINAVLWERSAPIDRVSDVMVDAPTEAAAV